MRILVTSTPGTGHVNPIAPLARELSIAGHEIVWATAPQSCAMVESLGFRAVPAGLDSPLRKAAYLEKAAHISSLPPRRRREVALPVMFGDVAAPAMHGDLVALFDDVSPQVVVHDFAEFAAAPLASDHGIPHVTIGFSGAISDVVQALVLQSVAPLWGNTGSPPTAQEFNGELFLHPFPASMNTPRPDGPSAPMRPVPFEDGSALAPEWVAFFGRDRPGVYVSFGTEIAALAPWRAILDALADLDVDVVATVGSQLDLEALGSVPINARVERYIPQNFLLARASLVVSHAGAGTLIGATSAGKVQLNLPVAADQWDNADLLSAVNVGITLEEGERDTDTIRHSVEHLLADLAMLEAANAVQIDFARMPHPREVVSQIEDLV